MHTLHSVVGRLGDWHPDRSDPAIHQHHPHLHRHVHLLPVEARPGHDHLRAGGPGLVLLPDQDYHGPGHCREKGL